jgi:hypothetical protein
VRLDDTAGPAGAVTAAGLATSAAGYGEPDREGPAGQFVDRRSQLRADPVDGPADRGAYLAERLAGIQAGGNRGVPGGDRRGAGLPGVTVREYAFAFGSQRGDRAGCLVDDVARVVVVARAIGQPDLEAVRISEPFPAVRPVRSCSRRAAARSAAAG